MPQVSVAQTRPVTSFPVHQIVSFISAFTFKGLVLFHEIKGSILLFIFVFYIKSCCKYFQVKSVFLFIECACIDTLIVLQLITVSGPLGLWAWF